MILTVDHSTIAGATGLVNALAPPDPNSPNVAITSMRFSNENGKLRIDSVNDNSSFSILLDAAIDEDFSFGIPYKQFSNLLKITSDEITLEYKQDGRKVKVKQGKSKIDIPVISTTSFPVIPVPSDSETLKEIRVTIGNLIHGLQCALVSSGKIDSGRWKLSGVSMVVEDDKFRLYNCDGAQISKVELEIKNPNKLSTKKLVPYAAIRGLIAALKSYDIDDQIVINFERENLIEFKFDNWSLLMRLLTGEYPDVEKTLNFSQEFFITFNSLQLLQIIQKSLLFSPGNGYCELKFEDRLLTISAKDVNLGSYSESIEITEKFEFAQVLSVNGAQFVECLKQCGKEIEFSFSLESRLPIYVKSNKNNIPFQYLGMRMISQ